MALEWGTTLSFTFGTSSMTVTSSKPCTAVMFCGSVATTNFCIPTVFSETSGSYRINGNSRNFESGYGGGRYGSMIATWSAAEFSGIPSVDLGTFASQSDLYAAIKAYDIGTLDGTVTGITINAPDSVTRGLFISVTVDVTGTGDFDTSVTCTISGNEVATTILDKITDKVYRLYCSSQEPAESITVTATSVADSTISASKTISVVGDSGDDSGGDSGDGGDTGGDSGGTGGDGGGGIIPEGTLEITENGSYDVTEYASVEVNVPFPVADIKAAWWSGFATAAGLYGCGK